MEVKQRREVNIILFHLSDLDGQCSAAICDLAWKYKHSMMGYEPHFVPFLHNYDFNIDMHLKYRDVKNVFMLDIMLKPETILNLMERKIPLIAIDHHQTSIDDSIKYKYSDLPGIRSTEDAACVLTWKYFFPDKEIPAVIRYIGNYDIWNREDPKTDYVNSALNSYNIFYRSNIDGSLTKNDSRMLLKYIEETDSLNDLFITGEAIERYRKKQWYMLRNRIMFGNVHGLDVLLLNHTGDGSRPFEHVDYPHDAVISFAYRTSGEWSFSIFSKKEGVDVSKVALSYGGGGHPGASGWSMSNIDDFIKEGNFVTLRSKLTELYHKNKL